jgi:hypothetical protein
MPAPNAIRTSGTKTSSTPMPEPRDVRFRFEPATRSVFLEGDDLRYRIPSAVMRDARRRLSEGEAFLGFVLESPNARAWERLWNRRQGWHDRRARA